MTYTIGSLNCNGLRDSNKRKQLFAWLNEKPYDILFLQETHSITNDEVLWMQEWGGNIIYAHGSSNSRGVAMLIKYHVNITIEDVNRQDGRLLVAKVTFASKQILLCNIYAPNDDNVPFFENVFAVLADTYYTDIIIGGDFNFIVMDIEKDKLGGLAKTHSKSCAYLKQKMSDMDLIDKWRIKDPDVKQFTWRRRNPTIHCRLDMFIISDSLAGCISKALIVPGFRSDHSLVHLKCTLSTVTRGPGYWKLNCSLLSDIDYVSQINNLIETYLSELNNDNDPNLTWEYLKMLIRTDTMRYSSIKKKQICSEQMRLEREIDRLENAATLTDIGDKTLQDSRDKLKEIFDHKIRGSIIRSKIHW